MKKILCIIMFMTPFCYGENSLTAVNNVEGNALHSIQNAWQIVESENSGDTQATVLGNTERTKLLVDAAIAAGASGDDNISVFAIPAKWNAGRFRALGITNNGTCVHDIYLGSLGRLKNCELTYSGSLAWVIGQQTSIYDQITFTSGGTYVPKVGETVTGVTSGETAVIVSISALSSGSWAAGDAAGTITYKSASGAFTSSEKISIVNRLGVTQADVLTHAASDLVDFELADACVITAKTGIWIDAVSPADDTNAEAQMDFKGADYMVIVTSATTADTKLLLKGF